MILSAISGPHSPRLLNVGEGNKSAIYNAAATGDRVREIFNYTAGNTSNFNCESRK